MASGAIDIGEATKVIREMIHVMDPEEDYVTIVAAEQAFASAQAKKKKQIDQAHANLKALTKALDAARISSTRPASAPSLQEHEETLHELDNTRLSLAKSISQVEGQLGGNEGQLTSLKETARRLEEEDPAMEHNRVLDGSALRLQIYGKLGFEPVLDKSYNAKEMFVQSSQTGDVQVVDLRQGTLFDHANKLWSIAAS